MSDAFERLIDHEKLEYIPENRVPSWCWWTVLKLSGPALPRHPDCIGLIRYVVVFTEPNEGSGVSVTNAVVTLVKKALRALKIKRYETLFLEHYEGRNYVDRIVFMSKGLETQIGWKAIDNEDLEHMLGIPMQALLC